MRGSVSIALALSIPAVLSGQETIIATVFGVVLFTLLAQGLTIKLRQYWYQNDWTANHRAKKHVQSLALKEII